MAVRRLLSDLERALSRLEEAHARALNSPEEDYPFFRDSAVQRFEFTVEIFWKSVKSFLREFEGIDCRSPKSCIREFFSQGYIGENMAVKLLEMIDYRNLTSHTYKEDVAEAIFSRLPGYMEAVRYVLEVMREKVG